jgi:serine/threonine-protein kinase
VAIVPDVAGLTGEEAMLRLALAGLIGGCVGSQVCDSVPRGLIVESSPGAGEELPVGSNVFLFDSLGPDHTGFVPDVAGTPVAKARAILRDAGYLAVELPRSAASIEAGFVIGTMPATGTRLPPAAGIGVTVFVSTGPAPVAADWPDAVELRRAVADRVGVERRELRVDAVDRLRRAVDEQRAWIGSLDDLIGSLRAAPEPDTALIDQLGADVRELRIHLTADEAELTELATEPIG